MTAETLQSLTQSFEEAVKHIDVLGGRLKFDLGADGIIFLDGAREPAKVSNGDEEADCVVEIGFETLTAMMAGRTDSRTAFQQGKMCLVGDMRLAFRLAGLLSSANAVEV